MLPTPFLAKPKALKNPSTLQREQSFKRASKAKYFAVTLVKFVDKQCEMVVFGSAHWHITISEQLRCNQM